jgi:ribosomal protein L11 methyltransferase
VTPFLRISVRAPVEQAETLRARFVDLSPAGFEEVDVDGATVELAAYVEAGAAARLSDALPGSSVTRVADGWEDAWRAFHRPVSAGGLWIGPPWETAPDPARAIVIDPGRAFGTGAHPTTRLCVELLARSATRGALLDVGCGSGVLAIAAARLGYAPVHAVDVDPVAVETTRANAAANGVLVTAGVVDAVTGTLPAADVAVVNVLLRPVETILRRLDAREALTSGYPMGDRPVHPGWEHVEQLELDGWAADRFRRARRALPRLSDG